MVDFYSLGFVLFLGLCLLCYYTVFRKKQWMVALSASLAFYLYAGGKNILALLFTAITIYWAARSMDRAEEKGKAREEQAKKDPFLGELSASEKREQRRLRKQKVKREKRIYLYSALFLNLLILCYTKYWTVLFHHRLGLLLPLGISFYTFQSIGYLIDIYNGKYEAEKSFPKYLLFVSWFPQLLQGPIGRYDALAHQFTEEHRLSGTMVKNALFLILLGCLKKYAIADLLYDPVARILDGPVAENPGSLTVFGILLYSAQQYADFSGGIDMVTGISALFGITLAPNFRQPYFATSLGDFWRRWHISLGAFMRDYIFYPLALTKPMMDLGKKAGQKYGKHIGRVLPACIANIVVFIVVGVWHGPQFHFLVWGLYNGIVIALGDLLEPCFSGLSKRCKIPVESKGFHVFRIIRTFVIVNIGWYFDRIEDVSTAFAGLWRSLSSFQADQFVFAVRNTLFNSATVKPIYMAGSFCIAAVSMLLIFVISLFRERGKDPVEVLEKSIPIHVVAVTAMLFLTLLSFMFVQNAGGFLYANF